MWVLSWLNELLQKYFCLFNHHIHFTGGLEYVPTLVSKMWMRTHQGLVAMCNDWKDSNMES